MPEKWCVERSAPTAMELSGSVREVTREQPLLQSEDARGQTANFSHFEAFPGFGKDRKKDLQGRDWMMCDILKIFQAKT